MQLENSYLCADVDLDEVRKALKAWSWFLKGNWSPILVSAVGDIFLQFESGEIFRLDAGAGELEFIAPSVSAFQGAMQFTKSSREWFLAPVVDELRLQGKTLARGQCYGFTVLPVFKEGSYKAENRFILGALEHIRYTGDMHLQIKDLRDGDRVSIEVVD